MMGGVYNASDSTTITLKQKLPVPINFVLVYVCGLNCDDLHFY